MAEYTLVDGTRLKVNEDNRESSDLAIYSKFPEKYAIVDLITGEVKFGTYSNSLGACFATLPAAYQRNALVVAAGQYIADFIKGER